ncbi:MAG: hypothetical protein H3C43_07035, partial [Leptonema sp. (in: Bacteria)]|nr:hypothetical protein [Leptonema sp. (in: bacteria)]
GFLCLLILVGLHQSLLAKVPIDPDDIDDTEEQIISKPQVQESTEKRTEALTLLKNRILYAASTERRNAIRDLRRFTKEEQAKFYPDLSTIVKTDKDIAVREAALRYLAEEGADTTEAKEAYRAGLDDAERNVKIEALKGIRKIEMKEAAPFLEKLISESELTENDSVIHAAIRTLGGLKYESTELTERFMKAIDDSATEAETKRSIVLYAGSVKSVSMKAKILELVEDQNQDITIRSYAANTLGKTAAIDGGTASSADREQFKKSLNQVLEEIREIRDGRGRARMNPLKQQSILALIRMGDDSVSGELQNAAQDDDAGTRLRAIRYIGELKLKQFKELVEFKSKHDDSPKVRKEAERVLKDL